MVICIKAIMACSKGCIHIPSDQHTSVCGLQSPPQRKVTVRVGVTVGNDARISHRYTGC